MNPTYTPKYNNKEKQQQQQKVKKNKQFFIDYLKVMNSIEKQILNLFYDYAYVFVCVCFGIVVQHDKFMFCVYIIIVIINTRFLQTFANSFWQREKALLLLQTKERVYQANIQQQQQQKIKTTIN